MTQITRSWFRLGVFAVLVAIIGFSCQRSPQNVQAAGDTLQTGNGGKDVLMTPYERQFMKEAEENDIKERNLGRFVLEKSQNSDVRGYAQMLVDDHAPSERTNPPNWQDREIAANLRHA